MDRRKPGPGAGGSARAKAMLAAAQSGAKATPRRQSGGGSAPPLLTFSRTQRQKREVEGGGLKGSMQSTPKKQRLPTAVPAGPRPLAALRPSSALLPPTQGGALNDATCTRVYRASADKAYFLSKRQEWLEAEERRHFSGGMGSVGAAARLPAGMRNLGNTCYMNAVLQVLLSLPSVTADLRRGRTLLESGGGGPLSSTGVYAALLECLAAKERSHTYITPASLKRALDAHSAAFQGAFQQDAHELFCGLLDMLQSEVLAREVQRLGRSRVRISETADPAARNFSFSVQHELECSACGHTSRVVEEYMHLSLELPEPQHGSGLPETSVVALLREYFKEEEVEKSCEACGSANLAHRLRHTLRRLPRVLVLHMKRFKVSWSPERRQAVCQKLHTRVEMPDIIRLERFLAASGARPPLPGGAAAEPGKENEQQVANAEVSSPRAAAAGSLAEAAQARQARPLGGLQRRTGGNFYGSGGSTVAASSGLLSPLGWQASTPQVIKRCSTPAAIKGASALREDDDTELQQALALSLLDCQPGQQQADQQQHQHQRQQQQQQAAPMLVRARPYSSEAAEVFLPTGVEAAVQSARPYSGDSCEAGGGLGEQSFMRLGRLSADRRSSGGPGGCGLGSGGKSAAQLEADDLAHALALSRREFEQQQQQQQQQQQPAQQAAPCSTPPAGGLAVLGSAAAAAAAAEADADLQRALELSRLEAGLDAGVFPFLGGSPAVLGSPGAAGGAQQSAGELSAFDLILQDSPLAAAPAAGTGSPPGEEAGSSPVATNAAVGSTAAAAAAPAYVHAEIVEDDAPLADSTAGTAGLAGSECTGAPPVSPAAAKSDTNRSAAAGAAAASAPADAAEAAAAAKLVHYRLHASVAHQGPAASCGHFTADVCDPASRVWHRLDDSVASRISAAEARSAARQRECYLLFYVAG